ncbi:MAP3K12-binding inhibitory protein 1-like [Dysidea avara]|uniref:MAP3K12-binding inhibitory protein 1-like n=1 Tax=Dysidea avara TaxID=196820 RepID=UPI0033169639
MSSEASTQTSVLDTSDSVQICATRSEVQKRITAFMKYKRQQIDISNQHEFCSHPPNATSTCARTDSVKITRLGSSTSHISVHVVHNKTGPLSASGCVTELRAALTGPSALPHHKEQQRSQDNTFWPLEERLSSIEEYLQVHNKRGPAVSDVHSRIQQLEKQLIELESFSPEYVQTMVSGGKKSRGKAPRTHPYHTPTPTIMAGHPAAASHRTPFHRPTR